MVEVKSHSDTNEKTIREAARRPMVTLVELQGFTAQVEKLTLKHNGGSIMLWGCLFFQV